MHNKKMFNLENVGQGDGAQQLQLCHAMKNTKICKRHYSFFALSFTISEIFAFKIFDLNHLGHGREENINNVAIWRQISTSIKVIACIFMPSLTIFKILTFQMFDIENLGQGHRVQHL